MVWLLSKNISTERLLKKLENKQLKPFKILAYKGYSYQLDLPKLMQNYRVFHIKLLRKNPEDPLFNQINPPPKPIIIVNKKEWPIEKILIARRFYKRLQYKVK